MFVYVKGYRLSLFFYDFSRVRVKVMVSVKLRNYSDNDILFNIFRPPTQRSEKYCF